MKGLLLVVIIPTLFIGCGPTLETVMEDQPDPIVYIGTYTHDLEFDATPDGIYRMVQDQASGHLSKPQAVAQQFAPSFLTTTKDGQFLYAVSELWGDGLKGEVFAYRIGPDVGLEFLNKLSAEGESPCHISLDQAERFLFVSNYGDGVVAVYKRMEGKLVHHQTIQLPHEIGDTGPRAHSAFVSADDRFVYVPDLGQSRIWIFTLNENGLIASDQGFLQLEEGSGPRHFAFHPYLDVAYAINEYANTVVVLSRSVSTGELELLQSISTLPEGFEGRSFCADIRVHPNGRFLYGSNRGHNSIAIFKIVENGLVELAEIIPSGGDWPRNFNMDPQGRNLLVAHERSNEILSYQIDPDTGGLSRTQVVQVHKPVCIDFLR